MGLTPREMGQRILANLATSTGRSFDEWKAIVERDGPVGYEERGKWLRSEYGLGGPTAFVIAWKVEGHIAEYEQSDEELIAAQYAGKRAHLRPICDALLKLVPTLGPDARIAPCNGYVPVMRKHQFAIIKATTQTRVDLGLALKGVEHTARVQPTKGLGGGDKISHVIALTSPKDVDAEVRRWLKLAYASNK